MRSDHVIDAKFAKEDWERIVFALREYVRLTEDVLKQHNVGDREWDNLSPYVTLAQDIQFYVLPPEKGNAYRRV